MVEYTRAQLVTIAAAAAEAAATKAVHQTLTSIGIDTTNPLVAQDDFATLRKVVKMVNDPDYRKDWEHVRWWREFLENLKNKGAMTAIGLLVTGLLTALWYGLQDLISRGH